MAAPKRQRTELELLEQIANDLATIKLALMANAATGLAPLFNRLAELGGGLPEPRPGGAKPRGMPRFDLDQRVRIWIGEAEEPTLGHIRVYDPGNDDEKQGPFRAPGYTIEPDNMHPRDVSWVAGHSFQTAHGLGVVIRPAEPA